MKNINASTANSVITVDLKQIAHNVDVIKKHIGPSVQLMITAKSNGYGHGLVEPAVYIYKKCGITQFATSMVSEALELRDAGIDCFLMVLGGVPYSAIPAVVENDLVTPAYDEEYLRLLNIEAGLRGKRMPVHIKIDTGLRRLGVKGGDELDRLLDYAITLPFIELQGVYTHLSSPQDDDQVVTHKQLELFNMALEQIKNRGIKLRYIHAANSDAVTRCRESHYNLVRPAALWLGYDPSCTLDVKPAISWRTFVSNVIWADAGESISYFGSCIMKRRTRVAVLGFGGGDGYVRNLVKDDTEKNGVVLIHGKRALLLALNMDQAYADVTDIPDVKINDEVFLLGRCGNEEITMDELGRMAGTSTGHIQCSLGSRPLRVYTE
ncbi:MAG: alanine racemase [Clostridia bacterium]